MVIVMVGINSINISIGVTEFTPPKPESKEPLHSASSVGEDSGDTKITSQIEPLKSKGGVGPREIQLDDNIVLRISFDDDSGRFIYSGVDKATGEVVRQFPPEGVLKLLAQRHEDAAGLILDKES